MNNPRFFWLGKYWYRQLAIVGGYAVAQPLVWLFLGSEWWSYFIYSFILAVLAWSTVFMYRGRKRHFLIMTALYTSFESMMKNEKEPGWKDCQLCGQKKMCVKFIDRWMCEGCYVEFHKYWQQKNPYVKSGWLYKP